MAQPPKKPPPSGSVSIPRRFATTFDTGRPLSSPLQLRVSTAPPSMPGDPGAYVLRVLDVAHSIAIDQVFQTLEANGASLGPSALRTRVSAGLGGVLLSSRPIDLEIGTVLVGSYRTTVRVRLFEFGVAAVRFRLDLPDQTPTALVALSAALATDASFDGAARLVWTRIAAQLGSAVRDPSQGEFIEDYIIFVLPCLPGVGKRGGDVIARMLLGEDDPRPLAPEQTEEMWRQSIRYFEDDEVFIDYDAAVVIEPSCTTELVDILELATAHLLELRYYDTLANRASERIAADVAASGRASWLLRSPFSGVAERAIRVVLEVGELTDRFERSITLVGDNHSVQVYTRAAARFRIAEARAAVQEKISVVARTAEVLTSALHARRGFLLEVLVVVLITLELLMALYHR